MTLHMQLLLSSAFTLLGHAWWRYQIEAFPLYWPFVRGIHRSPVDPPHKGHWRGSLMFSLISAGTNGWANTRDAGGLRRHRAHCDVTLTYMKNESSLSIYPILWHCFICMIFSIKKALTFHILKTSKFWPSDFTTDDILQSEWNPGTKH